MGGSAYYNENDPKAAAWLRELIAQGHLPAGEVDDRSIAEVQPGDLAGYAQCHFFAGIGGWPLALRWAGWPDWRPVWTGSCPCQPFSVSGQGRAYRDDRHLAPVWLDLIAECRPPALFGEQVASADGRAWLGALRAHLEDLGYVAGAADLCAAGAGAPHIRQRLYFGAVRADADWAPLADGMGRGVAGLVDGELAGLEGYARHGVNGREPGRVGAQPAGPTATAGCTRGLADANGFIRCADGVQSDAKADGRRHDRGGSAVKRLADGSGGFAGNGDLQRGGQHRQRPEDGGTQRMADSNGRKRGRLPKHDGHVEHWPTPRREQGHCELAGDSATRWSGAHHPGWRDVDWLHCTDGKWRPVEPGSFPLDHGIPARLVRLRGYGNAIVPQLAAEFVQAFGESS